MEGGGDREPPYNAGGEFLLSLLRKPQTSSEPYQINYQQQQHQHQSYVLDPAVAAVGPSLGDFHRPPWQSINREYLATQSPPTHHPRRHTLSAPNLLGFQQFPTNHIDPNQFHGNQRLLEEEILRLGLAANRQVLLQQQHQHQHQNDQQNIQFGSFPSNTFGNPNNGNSFDNSNSQFISARDHEIELVMKNRLLSNSYSNGPVFNSNPAQNHTVNSRDHEYGTWRNQHPDAHQNRNYGNNRTPVGHVNGVNYNHRDVNSREDERVRRLSPGHGNGFNRPPAGSNLPSVSGSDVEDSLAALHRLKLDDEGDRDKSREDNAAIRREDRAINDFGKELVDSLLLDEEADEKDDKKQQKSFRDKEYRMDSRGKWLMSQRERNQNRMMPCRNDIDTLDPPFLSIYHSLIPPEEEKAKQKQLLALLEKLVNKEWPEAKLYLYGSCANSFGVSKSDVDVCLAIEDANVNKPEILMKLAEILESENLQNVQALTRARVPIVKLMDPATGISCDICINNVLAVVNTKLLADYAQIDKRLHQLAFIVKHWAKSRRVNETYHGTLSSYAYVLMCIYFLQQRRPAILPCLQGLEPTYSVTVDNIKCAYFNQVDRLHNFGSRNTESISRLVWGFFNYWAYGHDYANSAISVRTGNTISKREKDWTRRIGNDRHLICIEDPFEITHDLGRVVDKYSIRVLREEFERAADIMQRHSNPCDLLFQPYVRK